MHSMVFDLHSMVFAMHSMVFDLRENTSGWARGDIYKVCPQNTRHIVFSMSDIIRTMSDII